MAYERRTSLQFQKDLREDKDFSITYQGFGVRRSEGTPQTFAVITINGIYYIDKKEVWREKYPYSDATFRGKKIDMCIHTDCPSDWYSNKGEKQFLRIDSVDEEEPLTIYWNIGGFTSLSMIQNSLSHSGKVSINLSLDSKESYFMDLDRKLCHEIKISSLTVDFDYLIRNASLVPPI